MNEQQKQEILQKLDKKIKEINKNEKEVQEYCTKIKLFNKEEFYEYLKKIKKEVQKLDIEEITMATRLLFK